LSKFDEMRENLEHFTVERCRFASNEDFSNNQTWKKLKTLKILYYIKHVLQMHETC